MYDLTFRNSKTFQREHECNQIRLNLIAKSTEKINAEYVSCGFIKEMSPYIFNSEYFSITLSTGSIMLIPSLNIRDSMAKSQLLLLRPGLSKITFKLIESDSNLVLVGSNGNLYFTLDKCENSNLFEIAGNYQDARVCWSHEFIKCNITKLVAISGATIFGFALNYSNQKDYFVYLQLFKINAHQDYLTFIFVKGF